MRVVELETQLAERLRQMPDLRVAEIVGPWVTGGPALSPSLDLLLVVDVDGEPALSAWRREHLDAAFEDLERDMIRPIETLAFTSGRLLAEARRGSAVLAAVYSRPRLALVSSLDEILDPEMAAALAGRALTIEEYTADLLPAGAPA